MAARVTTGMAIAPLIATALLGALPRHWPRYGLEPHQPVPETRGLQEFLPILGSGFLPSPWQAPEQWAPDFPSFNSPRLDAQIRLYAAYVAEFGVPDILIVGSSRSLQGIDPAALQDALTKQRGNEMTVYNFSINGATAQVVDFIVRQVLTPDQLPNLIIWGDGSRAFNSLRDDATFAQVLSSPGNARLQTGEHPIRYPISPLFHQGCGDFLDRPDDRSASSSETQACDRRQQIWRDLGISAPSASNDAPDATPQMVQEQWVKQYGDGLTAQGFSSVAETFIPEQYYQTYPDVPGAYDTDYLEFSLSGEQTQAVYRLVNYLNRQQVPVVFVNLPLSPDYMDAFRQEREQQFSHYLSQLEQQPGFFLRDLNQPEFSQNQFFADPSHLNQTGAEAIALHLANDLTLPWGVDQP